MSLLWVHWGKGSMGDAKTKHGGIKLINPWIRSGLPTRKRFTTLKTLRFSKLMCLIPGFFKVDVSKSAYSVK